MQNDFNDRNTENEPIPPRAKAEIHVWESIFSIGGCVLFAAWALGLWHWFDRVGITNYHEWMSVLDIAVMRSQWLSVVFATGLCICGEIFAIIERRYTPRLAAAIAVVNSIAGLFFVSIFGRGDVINPEFARRAELVLGRPNIMPLQWAAGNLHFILMGIILAVLVYDTGYTIFRALRQPRPDA